MSKQKILAAMSGGVDSSVAAALLVDKGYEVTGLTMKAWNINNDTDIEDAGKVAELLGIAHHVISFDEIFEKEVVDYFIKEYMKGRTPNPCAVCNPAVKFGAFFDYADSINAEWIATGHYARISKNEEGRMLLLRGMSHNKDQSYFLARLSERLLGRVLFPAGEYTKKEIRGLAARYHLPVSEKSESQEACFIPDGNVADFIKEKSGRTFPQGDIVDKHGVVLGRHNGIIGYTIGQRKGLGIALGKPAYVTGIDVKDNLVIVGDDEDLFKKHFISTGPNWIGINGLDKPMDVNIKIRYKHEAAPGRIFPWKDNGIEVRFKAPQRAITPGQLAVFYQDDIVLGSAWIEKTLG